MAIRPDQEIQTRIGLGTPGSYGKKLLESNGHIDYTATFNGTQDARNAFAIQQSGLSDGFPVDHPKDLIKFKINVIDSLDPFNSDLIIFRAFLDDFSDDYTAGYNNFKYNGRAENFYVYNEFDRGISFSFKIAAQTKQEMKPLYQKINTLVSSTTPTYNNNFMRGTLVKMTVGDYIYELPGFLNNVNLSWQTDYPWEIAMSRPEDSERDSTQQELPMVLDCSLSFTPIHDFLPTAENVVSGDVFKANRYITHGSDESNTIITNLFEDE